YRVGLKEGKHAYRTQYTVITIGQTFIESGVYYNMDLDKYYIKQMYVNRRFYTPMTRLVGDFTVSYSTTRDSVPNLEGVRKLHNFKSTDLDVWLGHSKPLYYRYNNLHKVQTNFITSLRYYSRKYSERPSGAYDPYNYYTNQRMYLGTI